MNSPWHSVLHYLLHTSFLVGGEPGIVQLHNSKEVIVNILADVAAFSIATTFPKLLGPAHVTLLLLLFIFRNPSIKTHCKAELVCLSC